MEDWIAYFGDPKKQPSYFTFLLHEVQKVSSDREAEELIQKHKELLTKEESNDIQKKHIEKGIESFYVDRLSLLEKGLALIKNGRQYLAICFFNSARDFVKRKRNLWTIEEE